MDGGGRHMHADIKMWITYVSFLQFLADLLNVTFIGFVDFNECVQIFAQHLRVFKTQQLLESLVYKLKHRKTL